MNKLSLAVAIAGVLLAHGAEAKKYACNVPKGATCMSTEAVYEATNASDSVNGTPTTTDIPPPPPVQQPVPSKKASTQSASTTTTPAPKGKMVFVPTEQAALAIKGDSLSVVSPVAVAPTTASGPSKTVTQVVQSGVPKTTITTNSYEPFLEPAKIMQVYIAAWQDEYGDLHLSERIVTEIVPRKWSIGVEETGSGDNYQLLTFPGSTQGKSDAAPGTPGG